MTAMSEISVQELRERLAGGQELGRDLIILDVREAHEVASTAIPGSLHIPLGEVVSRMGELDPSIPIVVQCRSGARSQRAIEALREAGYAGELSNLTGGILAWNEIA